MRALEAGRMVLVELRDKLGNTQIPRDIGVNMLQGMNRVSASQLLPLVESYCPSTQPGQLLPVVVPKTEAEEGPGD